MSVRVALAGTLIVVVLGVLPACQSSPSPTPMRPSERTAAGQERKADDAKKANDMAEARGILLRAKEIAAGSEYSQSDLFDVAVAQAKVGDVEGALRTATLLDDLERRPYAISQIAAVQARAGDVQGAFRTLEELQKPVWRDLGLGWMAEAQADAGDFDGALETALRIPDQPSDAQMLNERKIRPLIAIVAHRASKGDIQGALRTIDRIPPPWGQYFGVPLVVAAQIEAGDVEGARQTAAHIPDDSLRGKLLEELDRPGLRETGIRQAKAGNIPGALQTLGKIQLNDPKDDVLREVVAAQVRAGDPAGASQTARRIVWEKLRDPALHEAAEALAKAGDVPAAIGTANRIQDALERDQALGRVAAAQARAGDVPGALGTLESMMAGKPRVDRRAHALEEIAAARANVGDVPGALALANNEGSAYVKTRIFLGAARGILERWYPRPRPSTAPIR